MSAITGLSCVREKVPLAERTWFKLGGPAQYFAEPANTDELQAVVERCRDEKMQVRLLGGGSNVLVRDEGVSGMVISLAARPFAKVEIVGRTLTAGAGAQLANVITASVAAGLAGLEPLMGIPGTVGGALHGNAGTQAGDIGQWTCRAMVMTRSAKISCLRIDKAAWMSW
jgi:UDP-N-acetylmuramate dehydrogenase